MAETIVITGLADGMGREVAKILARGGDNIAGFDVDGKKIATLKEELKNLGGDHYLTTMDITDRKGIIKFRNAVLKKYGGVNTVLSNVGIGFFGPFEEVNLEKAFKCMEINVVGCAAIFQAFIPSMRENGGGKLIAMSSLVGRIPFPFESIYSATKFAVEGLVLSMRLELSPFNIRMAIIEPAQVSTSFAAKIHKLPPEGSPYRDRASRFIARDNLMIKDAPKPFEASLKIAKVVKKENPRLFNQVDLQSSWFLFLNRFLPVKLRDQILMGIMDIKL